MWFPVFIQSRISTFRTHRRIRIYTYSTLILILTIVSVLFFVARDAEKRYTSLLSVIISDRNNIPLQVLPNSKGHYALTGTTLADSFTKYLLTKEDQHFFLHPGINPVRILRALGTYVLTGKSGGSSTLTEQLAKNLLGTENNRTVRHKLRELVYVASLELFYSKQEILIMYANTVYLGNQVQGFETASRAYFNKPLSETNAREQAVLLATLSYPASRNPWKEDNALYAEALYARFKNTDPYVHPSIATQFSLQDPARFEVASMLGTECKHSCKTTIDAKVTQALRTILARTVEREHERGVRTGGIVVVHVPSHSILAVVGTPNPEGTDSGAQINMALAPRPIGSTIKPLIYLKGFMEGLRPYTLVDDREYRYPIATGFALYPKNFDGIYHGEITLHAALANSLNVPSVKVLEHIGLPQFYSFLKDMLGFIPLQPLENYQYGIALGGLEMDLLTLTHYFTLFPTYGYLEPLSFVYGESAFTPPQSRINTRVRIAPPEYTELVTAILKDRLTGVAQFGLESTLNLSRFEYAVKTGTSRDFHDSWVIGYTPELVVGVWLGNSENTPLAQVSGQSGAGAVWHDVMEYLFTTPYAGTASFSMDDIETYQIEDAREWGLYGDVVATHRKLLIDDRLITSPHEGDTFEYDDTTMIPLRAKEVSTWKVNGTLVGSGDTVSFQPPRPGTFEVSAETPDGTREILSITVLSPQSP